MSNKGDKGIKRTILKITMLGDSAVGKTCLLLRFTDDSFTANHLTTIGKKFFIYKSFLLF